ncbi:uncharacterized protein TNCV_1582621 [Trichonephila clavipes]|nr:uncharacterized protein TNCV_1582621 [Trichonephila clavipes]
MSDSMVRRWVRQFNEGRSEVHDEERSRRPSLITEELVHAIDEKIKENCKFTISALATEFPQISRSLMHEIVTDKLKFHKLCARCVPKILTESHKTKRMGCALEFLTRYHEGGVDFLSQEMKLGFLMTPLKVEQSKVWTQKIFEVFHIHKQELAKAINIKKLELKQGLTANLHIEFEDKKEDNPIYANEVTTDIIKQGQRMFNIALDLKKKETKAMKAELNLLKEAGNQDDHDVQKIPKPLEIMQNIIATAVDFKKECLQLPQQIKKYFSKSSDDLFEISKKSLAKELESNVHYQGKFQENIHLNEKEITSWDQVYQNAYDLIAKDLEKIQKFGLKEKMEEPDANRQYLDLMTENLPHWTNIFLDAASEIIKEMNPNQLNRMDIFEQHLQSQVVHDEFDLDHIILAVIEEFLKNYCDVCEGDEDLGSDKTAELHDLGKKFDKNNVSKQEEDETNNKVMY